MLNPLRSAVSRKKRRYKQDGFDLDLTCTSLIELPFPSPVMDQYSGLCDLFYSYALELQTLPIGLWPWDFRPRIWKVYIEIQWLMLCGTPIFRGRNFKSENRGRLLIWSYTNVSTFSLLDSKHQDCYKVYNLYVYLVFSTY
jgi:hypothetical protein